MTRDEIEDMPAGEEADDAIARALFPDMVGYSRFLKFNPSTDIADAWKVVEKFDNHCMLNNVHGIWECYLPENAKGVSKTVTLAICRAALLAVS